MTSERWDVPELDESNVREWISWIRAGYLEGRLSAWEFDQNLTHVLIDRKGPPNFDGTLAGGDYVIVDGGYQRVFKHDLPGTNPRSGFAMAARRALERRFWSDEGMDMSGELR